MANVSKQPAELIIHAGVSMFCQIGTHVSGVVAPVFCGLLQTYEMVRAAVVVGTRRSWRAVSTLAQVGQQPGPWIPVELEEFIVNLAVLWRCWGFRFG